MAESVRWEKAQKSGMERPPVSSLLKGKHLASLAGLIGMYGFWNLWAGTNGFFFPYILQTVGDTSQATAVSIQALSFAIGMASIYFVFMRLSDKVNQRTLFAWSAVIQVVGMALLAVFPLTVPVALLYVFLLQFGGGFGAHYNSYSKRSLGWLPDPNLHRPGTTSASNGIYRLYAYDQPVLEEGKRYALRVDKDPQRRFYLEYHPATGGLWTDSMLMILSGLGSNAGHLVDTTPGSSGGKRGGESGGATGYVGTQLFRQLGSVDDLGRHGIKGK